jgi:hypothetical protein
LVGYSLPKRGNEPGGALRELRSYPPRRTPLDAGVAPETSEDFPHVGRKSVESASIPVRTHHTDFDGLLQQAAVHAAFYQNKAFFLIVEHISVHDMKVVLKDAEILGAERSS